MEEYIHGRHHQANRLEWLGLNLHLASGVGSILHQTIVVNMLWSPQSLWGLLDQSVILKSCVYRGAWQA